MANTLNVLLLPNSTLTLTEYDNNKHISFNCSSVIKQSKKYRFWVLKPNRTTILQGLLPNVNKRANPVSLERNRLIVTQHNATNRHRPISPLHPSNKKKQVKQI